MALVQQFTAGQVVNFRAILPIPHEGPANVSIVKTATNQVLGQPLIAFDSYADESLATLPANNTNFDVTIPASAAAECAVAGDCVLQWFWFGTSARQTYESCVDFVIVGAAAGAGAGAGAGAVASAGAVAGAGAGRVGKFVRDISFGGVVGSIPSSSDAPTKDSNGAFGGIVGSIASRRRRSM